MPEKQADENDEHLDEKDLRRAEKGSPQKAPLAASKEDAYIPDTELTNSNVSDEEAAQNDPTAGRSATS